LADFKFQYGRNQISKIPRGKIVEELEKVAKYFDYADFREDDFGSLSTISYYSVVRAFGTWEKAMLFLSEHLKKKGIDFKITSRRTPYTNEEMFAEMERIWFLLGHRPSRNEWTSSQPNISFDAIYRRFGSWKSACLQFIEYKSGEPISIEKDIPEKKAPKTEATKIAKTRTIPLNVRIKVMSRDNFRCVFCGKSPATEIGTRLHIDHIIAFSKGGTNAIENLQTLCEQCNIGKSDGQVKQLTTGQTKPSEQIAQSQVKASQEFAILPILTFNLPQLLSDGRGEYARFSVKNISLGHAKNPQAKVTTSDGRQLELKPHTKINVIEKDGLFYWDIYGTKVGEEVTVEVSFNDILDNPQQVFKHTWTII